MALPINIEQLLDATTVESSRIEYKAGWNPDAIYRSICAFANDFDNIGGGYIIVGAEERNGRAVRPVKGLDIARIDSIEKEMIGFNNLMKPVYYPKTSIEDIDGKKVLAIWVPAGMDRAYQVPDEITARHRQYNYYIRYNSSSIIAKGQNLSELLEIASHVPFDDRGNMNASISDISKLLVNDFLGKTRSRLAKNFDGRPFLDVLKQMNLVAGPVENLRPKNVALMMFSEEPSRFFPYTEIDIVIYHDGKVRNPRQFIEVPPIKGPIDRMFKDTMSYLQTNVIKEKVTKLPEQAEAVRCFNYPYDALEEIVANALYHRDYQIREPIEITIEPDCIRVINFGGPDSHEAVRELNEGIVRIRRYRNRRIGEFFKELELTEGKSTGIPTVMSSMEANGSPAVIYSTNSDCSAFMAEIPVHPLFLGEPLDWGKSSEKAEKSSEKAEKSSEKAEKSSEKALGIRAGKILGILGEMPEITTFEIASMEGITPRAVSKQLRNLADAGLVRRVGGRKNGHWEIVEK